MRQVERRAAYYCRLAEQELVNTQLPRHELVQNTEQVPMHARGYCTVATFGLPWNSKHRHSRYVFDLNEVLCRFPSHLAFNYVFGDVIREPSFPAFVKSRPISDGTTRSVIMKLDKHRHFRFVNDSTPFASKKDMLVSRNWVAQPHRRLLLEKYFSHPACNLGKINTEPSDPHPEWVQPFMSIDEQLRYKFIACIEGNDVASNLKWVMSSNSLAVMPKPKYETWFMEGTLKPGVHYVEIKPDYSDLIEKMEYYISHPHEAEAIITQAHEYVEQFGNKRLEMACEIATAQAYFSSTRQFS